MSDRNVHISALCNNNSLTRIYFSTKLNKLKVSNKNDYNTQVLLYCVGIDSTSIYSLTSAR